MMKQIRVKKRTDSFHPAHILNHEQVAKDWNPQFVWYNTDDASRLLDAPTLSGDGCRHAFALVWSLRPN
jgi:hypothetical protein